MGELIKEKCYHFDKIKRKFFSTVKNSTKQIKRLYKTGRNYSVQVKYLES